MDSVHKRRIQRVPFQSIEIQETCLPQDFPISLGQKSLTLEALRGLGGNGCPEEIVYIRQYLSRRPHVLHPALRFYPTFKRSTHRPTI
jgi:hypothetical protein